MIKVTSKDGTVTHRKLPERDPLVRALATPGSLRAAIDAKCWQCQGEFEDPGVWKRIKECPITGCGLYHVRRK